MSLENPHKIAKKDSHLHEIAKKDGRLPYLVILCQHTVVVSLGECWVRYLQNFVWYHLSVLAKGGSYMSPFWNHILGFLYVEIAKIAVPWKLAKINVSVWGFEPGTKMALSAIRLPAFSVRRHFIYIPNKDRIHMNSYVRKLRSPGIWIHTFWSGCMNS